jgi:hypothetical protein
MFCTKCGTKLLDKAKFCSSCGSSLTSEAQPTAQASNQMPLETGETTAPSARAANASLYLGIFAIIAGNLIALSFSWVFPALVCSVGGVIWGVLGIRHANRTSGQVGGGRSSQRKSGQGAYRSLIGLICSGLAIISLASWGFLVSTGQNIVFDKVGVEKQMVDWLGSNYVAPTSVDCPETPTMKEGNTFECIANFSDSSTATIYVKVQDTSGNITFGTSPQ